MGIRWDSIWEYRGNVGIGLGFPEGRWPIDGVAYALAANPGWKDGPQRCPFHPPRRDKRSTAGMRGGRITPRGGGLWSANSLSPSRSPSRCWLSLSLLAEPKPAADRGFTATI